MQYQEQARNSNPGCADSGMEQWPDRNDSASKVPGMASNAPREAVTPTGGTEVYSNQEDRLLQEATPAEPSTSTRSHGAAIGGGEQDERRVHSPSHSQTDSAKPSAAAESYEQQHVHSVYESIASHFSSTRYKPWPFVASFLDSLPPGSVGLDVGCGNGKYLDVNRGVVILGSDRSANLCRLARDLKVAGSSGADVVGVADGLTLPFGGGGKRIDFAICIAVIHHLSTRERRIDGVRALLDCVRPRSGKVLVYVWALEQGSSRRGWDEGTTDQDQLVPWVMKSNKPKKPKKEETNKKGGGNGDENTGNANAKPMETTYQRYYHLYRKGELEEDAQAAGGEILGSGYEKDNWWVIASPKQEDCSPLP